MKKTSKNNLSQSGESLNLQRLFFFFAADTIPIIFARGKYIPFYRERGKKRHIYVCFYFSF
nr:MAG TPA: hypothetical protein [Caudoviricetes sp.]